MLIGFEALRDLRLEEIDVADAARERPRAPGSATTSS